jgi:cytosine/adenosine deaminase-related metal-dependent hydrolase
MNIEQQNDELLLTHGQIITMDRKRRILNDGAIFIRGGRIVAIGSSEEITATIKSPIVYDMHGALVHPGFIDAHVHLIYHLSRGMVPDYYPRNRIWNEIEVPLISNLTPEDEYLSSLLACVEMVSNGTTTFADAGSAFNVKAVVDGAKQVGIRGIVGEHLEDINRGIPKLYKTTEQCLERINILLELYPRDPDLHIWCAVNLVGMGRASDRLLKEAKKIADQHQVPLFMHQSYDEKEVQISLEKYGKRPIEHFEDLGILGSNLSLIRMIRVDEREIELLARSNVNVIHCPAASIKHGVGVSHRGFIPEMLLAGIPVALGSDSPNWSNSFDVALLTYLSATIHREARCEVPTISAEEALEMATLNGARALGIDNEVGSLEIGKRADLVIHSLNKPEAHPTLDPVSNLVYAMRSKTVNTVLINGQTILKDGLPTMINIDDLYFKIDAAAMNLAKRIGLAHVPTWHKTTSSK